MPSRAPEACFPGKIRIFYLAKKKAGHHYEGRLQRQALNTAKNLFSMAAVNAVSSKGAVMEHRLDVGKLCGRTASSPREGPQR